MIINELYINGRLVSLPKRFSIRLNRQLLTPAELNTKDAQFSYTVDLPPTGDTHEALGFPNIEETSDKFNREHTARYCVNGVEIFNGLLRLTSISADGYKANLYKPAQKTVKDIFGDVALNETAELRIPFGRFAESISAINDAARVSVQPAIFPFALYGLLPKVPTSSDSGSYGSRTVWDDRVYLGMSDIPPSLNMLTVMRRIFEGSGYSLHGTAFDDERLAKIYMSYKNSENYVMPWNYGLLGRVALSGEWDSIRNIRTGAEQLEKAAGLSYDGNTGVYNIDLLNSTNGRINVLEDAGGNVLYKEIPDGAGDVFASAILAAPVAGFYKLEFEASISVDQRNNWTARDPRTGILHMSGTSSESNNNFYGNSYEIKVLRGRGGSDFGLNSSRLDGRFYLDNLPQNDIYDEQNVPKYLPQITSNGQQIAVDLAQNRYILAGAHFGAGWHGGRGEFRQFVNPRSNDMNTPSLLFPKPAVSWNAQETTERTLAAFNNPGYWKYGRLNLFGNDEENPSANIDYSEGDKLPGRIFINGVETTPDPPADTLILSRFPLARYFTYTVRVPVDTVQEVYVYNGSSLTPFATVPVVNGVATFDTSQYPVVDFRGYLSLYLRTPDYNVDGTMILGRSVQASDSNPIGWEVTRRYAISLSGAPFNYVLPGQFDGAAASRNWTGQGRASVVVWLEAGELVTLASVSAEGRHQRSNYYAYYGLVSQRIKWRFSMEPYQAKKEWLKVSEVGTGTAAMSWSNPTDFDRDSINLMGFLSADVKANDFIENVVRAFNLQLTQAGAGAFELNVKQTRSGASSRSISIEEATSLTSRSNTPLGLPSAYRLGFTVDESEEGYAVSGDSGGGDYVTGSTTGDVIEQKSFFSYNWFKNITRQNVALPVPVITKAEVWGDMPYPEAMAKRYTDQPFRFWYYDGQLNDLGATFDFNGTPLRLAKVSNSLGAANVLNYKNKKNTILDNYFTLLIDGSSDYTEIEAYISAEEYKKLDGAILVRFNSDLYYLAEITGYDPTNRNKAKLKLIRRI